MRDINLIIIIIIITISTTKPQALTLY